MEKLIIVVDHTSLQERMAVAICIQVLCLEH